MMTRVFTLMTLICLLASPALAWKLVWDHNPASEGVVSYFVFEDGVQIAQVDEPLAEYQLNDPLPLACWQVTAVNEYGIQSDMSSQVCVGRPSAPGALRISQ